MNEDFAAALKEKGFEIGKMIGEGGFAQVFTVVWNKYPNQTFVAKATYFSSQDDFRAIMSYKAEINTLKKLFHKNIVKIFHNFSIDNTHIIIMEYYPYGTLEDLIERKGALKERDFFQIAYQCLDAINFCHNKMISHRDIKPSNIMVDTNFNVKLCDFGLAESQSDRISRFDGSLPFCPPELLKRLPHDPIKADIWSLGVTFYYLAVGRLPWHLGGKEKVIGDIINKNMTFPPDISSRIKKLILMMMICDPDKRPSAQQILYESDLFKKTCLKKSIRLITSLHTMPTCVASNRKLAFNRIKSGYTFAIQPETKSHDLTD